MKYILTLSFLFSLSLFAEEFVTNTEKTTLDVVENFSPMPHESAVQSNEDGVALDGFDTVSYFNQEKAVRGIAQYNCEYQGKTWHFSSADNRDTFLSDPEKFIPQYGGFCAHSLTSNNLIRSNPESFAIRDNKLYLYVNDAIAKKDINKKDNIFADSEKKRKKNWLNYVSNF